VTISFDKIFILVH